MIHKTASAAITTFNRNLILRSRLQDRHPEGQLSNPALANSPATLMFCRTARKHAENRRPHLADSFGQATDESVRACVCMCEAGEDDICWYVTVERPPAKQ
jgi:hypothetical protein